MWFTRDRSRFRSATGFPKASTITAVLGYPFRLDGVGRCGAPAAPRQATRSRSGPRCPWSLWASASPRDAQKGLSSPSGGDRSAAASRNACICGDSQRTRPDRKPHTPRKPVVPSDVGLGVGHKSADLCTRRRAARGHRAGAGSRRSAPRPSGVLSQRGRHCHRDPRAGDRGDVRAHARLSITRLTSSRSGPEGTALPIWLTCWRLLPCST